LLEGQGPPRAQREHFADLLSGSGFELNLLRAYRMEWPEESARLVGI